MSNDYKTGPHDYLESADGQRVPLYIIRFDKTGQCLNPQARNRLLAEAAHHSDAFLFAHGWNNDWSTALKRYRHFFAGYTDMRRQYKLPMPENYKPLLAGVVWPSTALVFGESEKGPKGENAAAMAAIMERQAQEEVEALADFLASEEERAQLRALANHDELSDEQARQLASLVAGTLQSSDGEQPLEETFSVDDLLEGWAHLPSHEQLESLASTGGEAQAAPITALKGWKKYDPRIIYRLLTVMKMKDRAGAVGTKGVGPLLEGMLRDTMARVHLQGHSYGAKVVLSALCASSRPARKAHSALLLQAAISRLCFADKVPKETYPGGYRSAPSRVERPILSTYSSMDFALYNLYHYVQWRARDVGEHRFFPAGEDNRRAALGGYGPRQAGEKRIPIQDVRDTYLFDTGTPVFGLDGSNRQITGHGDMSNRHTWWALYSLVS